MTGGLKGRKEKKEDEGDKTRGSHVNHEETKENKAITEGKSETNEEMKQNQVWGIENQRKVKRKERKQKKKN